MSSRMRVLLAGFGILIAAMCLLGGSALADVTIKQEGTMEGLGGFMNSEMKIATYIQGDKKCDETEMRFTNKMMKMMGGGKPMKTANIIMLDRDLLVDVNHQDKSYTERPLSELGEMATQFSQTGQMGQDDQFDTSKVTMLPPEFDIQQTGKKEKIAGYDCEQAILTMKVKGIDKESGDTITFITVMDLMLARDVPGSKELNDFNMKMIEKMGYDPAGTMNGSLAGALGAYGVNTEELRKKAAELEGFPLRTIATFDGEGGQFAAMQQMGEGEGDESAEENAAAAKMLKGLFGGGKSDDEGKGEDAGSSHFMKMTINVTEISTASIDTPTFEPPAKYKNKTPKD